MLSDINSEVTGFNSIAETERLISDIGCQTSDIQTSNQSTQTASRQSTASQAVPDVINAIGDHSYDADRLLKFLKRVLPHLEEELNSSDFNTALNLNPEFGNMKGEEEKLEPCKVTSLKHDSAMEKIVSSLAWDATNVILAVGFSAMTHENWCTHESSIFIYNTEKAQFEKKPSQILKVSACVQRLAFHDQIPSLLAAGLHNGDVVLWDLKQDKEVLIKDKNSSPHSQEITFLCWRDNQRNSLLITAGRDGKIITWNVSVANLTYEVNQKFIILKQNFTSTKGPAHGPSQHLGVLHMDFQPSKPDFFVTACEMGAMFYCSMTETAERKVFENFMDPVLKCYKQREGVVTSVSCHQDMFAVCGSDAEIQIFQYENVYPLIRIHTSHPGLGVKCNSPTQLIFWGGSFVECYNIEGVTHERTVVCRTEGENEVLAVAYKTQSRTSNKTKLAIGLKMTEVLVVRNCIFGKGCIFWPPTIE